MVLQLIFRLPLKIIYTNILYVDEYKGADLYYDLQDRLI